MVSLYSDIIFEQTAGFVLQIWTLLSPGKSNGSFLKATAPPYAIGFLISLLRICFKAWCRWTWHVLYLWKCNVTRISKSMFLSVWRANSQIQKVEDMSNMLHFWKGNKAKAHKFQCGKLWIRTVFSVQFSHSICSGTGTGIIISNDLILDFPKSELICFVFYR